MRHSGWIWSLLLCCAVGCSRHTVHTIPAPQSPAPFQQFVSQKFDWTSVRRVVLMPIANESSYAHAAVEVQTNLAAELQRAGFFDVVVATRDDPGARARDIFSHGQFDELELLRVARQYDAHAILFCKITQYEPWAPPRLGLSLMMICPGEGVAIASADGLWDTRELTTARQAQAYQNDMLSWRQSLLGIDRVLESPDVFQRFVCQQIATSLHPPDLTPVPALSANPDSVLPAGAMMTPENGINPSNTQLPPLKNTP